MKKLGLILLILSSLLSINKAKAWCMMGADITWTCVGQDSFLIKLQATMDCNGINLYTIPINFKCATTGATLTSLSIAVGTPVDITPVCNSSCTRCQNPSCSFPYGFRRYTMQGLVKLNAAGSCCNIVISWEWGSRNWAITTGARDYNYYTESKLNRCQNPCDNSPAFTNPPIFLLCVGQDFSFNHGAFDTDIKSTGDLADSLTYEWAAPLEAAGVGISYTGQYAYNKPIYFMGFPNTILTYPQGLHLDPHTGDMQFRPMKAEVTVMVIQVNEFRNGVKIGEIRRDLTIYVITCLNNKPPQVTTPNNVRLMSTCPGDTVTFDFSTNDYNSTDSVIISWNNALSGATWSHTNGQSKHPTATLKWVPTTFQTGSLPYTFTVTAKDNACPVRAQVTQAYQIIIQEKAIVNYTVSDSGCGKYAFETQVVKGSGLNFQWRGGIYNNSSKFIHQFIKQGSYPYTLSYSSDKYCPKIFYDTITTDTFLWIQHSNDTTICYGNTVRLNVQANDAKGKVRYKWSTGDTLSSITVMPAASAWYKFEVSDSVNCTVIDSVYIKVNRLLGFSVSNDTTICRMQPVTLRITGTFKYKWNTGEITRAITKEPLTSTWYKVVATDKNNCSSADSVYVNVNPLPVVDAGHDSTICAMKGIYKLKGMPESFTKGSGFWTGNYIYIGSSNNWYFDPGAAGIVQKGKYPLTYHFIDSNGCSNTDTSFLTVYKYSTADAEKYKKQCINGDSLLLNGTPVGGNWHGKGVNGLYFDPKLAGIGTHMLIYNVYDFCDFSDTTYISVYPLPNVQLNTFNGKTEFCPVQGFIPLIENPVGGQWSGDVGPDHYFSTIRNAGLYSVGYSYMDNNGCSNSDTLFLRVSLPEITIFTTQKDVCEGGSILLKATYNIADSILWSKDTSSNGYFYGNTNNTQLYFTPGQKDLTNGGFRIRVKTFSSICNMVTDSIYIRAAYNPKTDFSADLLTGNIPMEVSFSDLSASQSGNITGFYWEFGDSSFSNIQNPVHTYLNAGSYDVKLTTISDIGCKDSLKKENYIATTTTVTEGKNGVYITYYPNPAHNELFIENPNKKPTTLMLKDIFGKTLLEKRILPGKSTIHIRSFKPGLYFIFFDGKIAGKLLIE